ncbi:MAG: hypothetical protein U1E05_09085, partial [Patescibacteria group bacterium]|nr:hypothetical protein [Patescibacteria group bacterium]
MTRYASFRRRLAGSAVFMISMLVLPSAHGDLVSHWSFDTDLRDLSGNGNHGTSVNGAAVSSAHSAFGGGSLYLDGVNKAYVQTGN